MNEIDTVQSVIDRLPSPQVDILSTPSYSYKDGPKLGLAVASMKDHTTTEGWEIFAGLEENGYLLCGYDLMVNSADVPSILQTFNPSVVFLQDKREWDVRVGDFREARARFGNVGSLRERSDIFKLTILKDSQQRPNYHRESAEEIDCHAWVIYYHPRIVKRLAPYVREQHLIRTYHTVDPDIVPTYTPNNREGCLLSGAVSPAYPLRSQLFKYAKQLPYTDVLKHPGYHRRGSATPEFLQTLSRYKVAICTASMYGYALRKLIEATAAGCVVITNLPSDEVLPDIDDNLVRVPSDITIHRMAHVISHCVNNYDSEKQQYFAEKAIKRYDYKVETDRLSFEIEKMRINYV